MRRSRGRAVGLATRDPHVGDKPIDTLRHSDITDALAEYEFATAKTRNNTLIPLRQTLAFAELDNLIDGNPALKIKNSKVQLEAPDPLELDEAEEVLAEIAKRENPQVFNYFEAAIFTGMRVSEQIAVTWSDLDARRRRLRVARARVWGEDKKTTKTSLGRDIELLERAFNAIQRQRAFTQLVGAQIFHNPSTGRPWNDEQMQRAIWNATLKRLGIRHRPMKQTRHTFATIYLSAQANPAWVARQMGHSSTKMFFEVYSRWIEGADKGVELARVEAMIAAPPRKSTADAR